MSDGRTLYDELEVVQGASIEVILAAHKALVTKYHPDKESNVTEATRKTQRINHARDVLKDPQSRAEYDLTLLGTGPKANGDKSGRSRSGRSSGATTSPTCPKCGRTFRTLNGLHWHQQNFANCV